MCNAIVTTMKKLILPTFCEPGNSGDISEPSVRNDQSFTVGCVITHTGIMSLLT